jgi:hypothetical protein
MFRKFRVAATFAGLILGAAISIADAQPYGRGDGPRGPGGGPGMMGPGMMMGPGIAGPGTFDRMCGPSAAGFAEWRTDRLDQILKLTDAQRPKFDEFKAASAKAADAMRSACPTAFPGTMTARMELMEKRAEAMLQAIKTVRPALDAFYATLTDEQKERINSNSGGRRFWRWRDRW